MLYQALSNQHALMHLIIIIIIFFFFLNLLGTGLVLFSLIIGTCEAAVTSLLHVNKLDYTSHYTYTTQLTHCSLLNGADVDYDADHICTNQ